MSFDHAIVISSLVCQTYFYAGLYRLEITHLHNLQNSTVMLENNKNSLNHGGDNCQAVLVQQRTSIVIARGITRHNASRDVLSFSNLLAHRKITHICTYIYSSLAH